MIKARCVRRVSARQAHLAGETARPSLAVVLVTTLTIIVAGQLNYTLHILLTPHGYGRGGTLIHVKPIQSANCRPTKNPPSPQQAYAAAPGQRDDGKCQVHAVIATPSPAVAPPLDAQLLPWVLLSWQPPPSCDRRPVPLLALAPKQSPPRV